MIPTSNPTTGSMIPTSNPTMSSTNIPIESTIALSQIITSSIPATTIPLTTSDAGTSISTTLGCPTGSDSLTESCEPGWTQMQKKCYKLVTPAIPVTWDNADSGCKSLGSELASIESQCEQNTVFEVANKAAAWVGGNDMESEMIFFAARLLTMFVRRKHMLGQLLLFRQPLIQLLRLVPPPVLLAGLLLIATVTTSKILPRSGIMPWLTVKHLVLNKEKQEALSPSQVLIWSWNY